jgi:hypothetical protein
MCCPWSACDDQDVGTFFQDWLRGEVPYPNCADLSCFEEADNGRALVEEALVDVITDHLLGLEYLSRLVTPGALKGARERVPRSQRQRSGDFGEILASCWIDECTEFRLPLRRLRFKADREFPMHGDDLVAVADDSPPRLLKGEAKSRARLRTETVTDADKALNARDGRPKAETLGFLSVRLRERGEDALAETIEGFLDGCDDAQLEHVLFTVSGNDPKALLEPVASSARLRIRRHVVGVAIADHQAFIRGLFERVVEKVHD